ncbi:MAG: oligosaccharide flippase family protein [Phycisphaerae bacterium]|nr:oligosaccharide flippase family protein [Phycisphaerae bacterium]
MSTNAKKNLIINVGSNFLAIFISAIITIWLTPYLIKTLEVEVYGIIPLVTSLITYFNLLTSSISQSVGRFVTVSFNKDDLVESNIYFNTALGALLLLCGGLFVPVIVISVCFSYFFNVPPGHELASSWLCFMVIVGSFIMAISSPFMVSIMITNKFYLQNINQVLGKSLRVGVLVICFVCLKPSLVYFGISYLTMALFLLISFMIISRQLVPQLTINPRLFSRKALKQMSGLSAWIVVESVGAIFYISITYIVINVFLGSEQGGQYGPIAELVMLFSLLGASITNVFAPIAYKYIAKNEFVLLAMQLKRTLKFICLIMAYPIGLVCGLANPVLQRWLGDEFVDLAPLLLIIMIPWLVSISTRPCSAIFRGLNKAKLPALVTLVLGFVNALLSIILVTNTDLGLYGVGISLLICLTIKNLFFTTIYAAIITGTSKKTYFMEIVAGCIAFAIVFALAKLLCNYFFLATMPRLAIVAIIGAIVYFPSCYFVFINRDEKTLLKSFLSRNK